MKDYSDERLIKMLKSYDPKLEDEAMREIIRRYGPKIRKILLSKSAKEEDIKEVAHDSLMALMHNARKDLLDNLKQSLKGYFTGICQNKMYDKFNQKSPLQSLDQKEAKKMTDNDNILKKIETEEQKQWLRAMIQKLGVSCHEILERFYYNEQKMEAIALAMSYANEQVARNKKSKCLKKLRQLIDDDIDV